MAPQQPTTQLQMKANSTAARPKRFASQLHPKRRGNPDWGSGTSVPMPATMSEFERIVERLRLLPHEYVESDELREWAEKNKGARFVPERLLKAWGLSLRGSIDDIG